MQNPIESVSQPPGQIWWGVFPDSEEAEPIAIFFRKRKAEEFVAAAAEAGGCELGLLEVKLDAKCWNSYLEPSEKFERLSMCNELERLEALLNVPEIVDFLDGVKIEAAHQRERWGEQHDFQKHPGDWTLLFARQIGKMSDDVFRNDYNKYRHHLITLSAIAFNCHRSMPEATGKANV